MITKSFREPNKLLEEIEVLHLDVQKGIEKSRQTELGQFMTPVSIANMMAKLFDGYPDSVNILDPGAGVGALSAALITHIISGANPPKRISLTAYEIDAGLANKLRYTLEKCADLCSAAQIDFDFKIYQEDFILSSVQILLGKYSLFESEQPNINFIVMNPPYRKISNDPRMRGIMRSVGIETTNLYSAFLWIAMKLLTPDGEMVAIVPRSFCNGSYFKPFRVALVNSMTITKLHIFETRDTAFEDGDVLQENIIFHAKKNLERGKVSVSSNRSPSDVDIMVKEISFDQLVNPNDPDMFIRIIQDNIGHRISNLVHQLETSLGDLGLNVSTGKVVDFRSREFLRDEPDIEHIPLLYPGNFQNGYIVWPKSLPKKPIAITSTTEVRNLLIPSDYYVLVKRFSAKEENKRICAAVFDPQKIKVKRIGIENHINYFYRRYGKITPNLAKGLTLYLNSTLVDQYFRQFSGHTQVNASDLMSLKYPTESQLISLGQKVDDEFPHQDMIDQLLKEELALNSDDKTSGIDDPILAKRKIREALNLLQMLAVPRAQQNDRSALTLLALVNLKANSSWQDAAQNLIGITEMMDYFKEYFGINYAPNTRETVRRQTVHQFIQMGLVIPNPDNSERPINSPKTRYLIDHKTLQLIKSFGTKQWDGNLREFIRSNQNLSRLQLRERPISMVPVTLPDGSSIYLSSGGQNKLIKKIVEDFCPRFTPGGKIVYIGDAGEKISEHELIYFRSLGLNIDPHGKMPDIVVDMPEKKWLVLIEAVTSHGPVDIKRYNELKDLFRSENYGLVFVTAFETRKTMNKYLSEIAWETEVWIAETPSHLIHFNGEKFLGPY